MKHGRRLTVLLTLAVVFMMIIVPISSLFEDIDHSKIVLNGASNQTEGDAVSPISMPIIDTKKISYVGDGVETTVKTALDTTIVQMFPSTCIPQDGKVFNGWHVSVIIGGNLVKLYYLDRDADASPNERGAYKATSDPDASNLLKDNSGNPIQVEYRIMPGDGIVFSEAETTLKYNSLNGVLTIPSSATSITFTADWGTATKISTGGMAEAYAQLNNFDPATGDGTLFTNIIEISKSFTWSTPGYNSQNRSAKITSANENYVLTNATTLTGDTYFDNIKLKADDGGKLTTGYRLIMGENVDTATNNVYPWFSKTNEAYGDLNLIKYFNILASNNSIPSHIVVLGGTYGIISGASLNDKSIQDSYISIGSIDNLSNIDLASNSGPSIASVHGGDHEHNIDNSSGGNSHIVINDGTIMEIIGGSRHLNGNSTSIEINGGYVSYINGGSRAGKSVIGNGHNDAVQIAVNGGTVDYLFSGAKDGNSKNLDTAPIYGNVKILVSEGKIYGLFGGGYDFFTKSSHPGVIGEVKIIVSGGEIGHNPETFNVCFKEYIGNLPSTASKSDDYYSIDPGIYGGGYRGSVAGTKNGESYESTNIFIYIGGNSSTDPSIYGNVYGGGSGGTDQSNGGDREDTTGSSYIYGNTNIIISNSNIYGNVYGGGKGLANSSYIRGVNSPEIITDTSEKYDVATVFGNTMVQVQDGANITGNVYGGGKGVSRSVFIPATDSNATISPSFYGFTETEKKSAKYQWYHSGASTLNYQSIENETHFEYANTSYDEGFLRLEVNLDGEVIYSNPVKCNSDCSVLLGSGFTEEIWDGWTNELDKIAQVQGTTTVNVLTENNKSLTIKGNVYGGGSYSVVKGDSTAEGSTVGNTNVTINGGTIGGRVFGGGEGSASFECDWAGNVSESTNVNISKGIIKGSVYGGGNYGYVGTKIDTIAPPTTSDVPSAETSFATNIIISGGDDTQIAGSVYGGGRGDENDINRTNPTSDDSKTIYNSVVKGNVYGDTNVEISGGKIGYLDNPALTGDYNGWYDSEDAGNVFGGGKLGLVVGKTNVKISGGEIHRNVFGGGKGLSKSVFIELNSNGNEINSRLYNVIDLDHKTALEENGLNFSVVKSYEWQESNNPNSGFEKIENHTENSLTSPTNYKNYIRLKVVVGNDTIGTEDFYSNVIDTSDTASNLTPESWARYDRLMIQFGIVSHGTNVTVSGGAIHTNVYGGGSYGAVGIITGGTPESNNTYNFTHHIEGGTSNVTITGGEIGLDSIGVYKIHKDVLGGNVFGGGMGEPDLVTSGSIGDSTKIVISGGKINGNVYGGGENGFVGNVDIDVSKDMSPIEYTDTETSTGTAEGSKTTTTTWCYGLSIRDDVVTNGSTTINISGGTIGLTDETLNTLLGTNGAEPTLSTLKELHGNVFGGGKGANATVTKETNVTVSSGLIYGNVYGGGDFGCVGQFTGAQGVTASLKDGYTHVDIKGGEMNGVYGGGRGYTEFNDIAKDKQEGTALTSTQLSKLIFGSVGASYQDPGNAESTNTETVASGNTDSAKFNTNVTVTAGTINGNVYGGGELGLVSYLDVHSNYGGGRTSVIIGDDTILSNALTIKGSVYGGGQGVYTIDYSLFILGVVSKDTSVEVKNGTIEGSIYGGGMYGLVGTYHSNDDINPSNADKLVFEGGPTKVTVSGGNIHTNVYGGGQGGINNLSGAVGKTEVNISGGHIGPDSSGMSQGNTPDFSGATVTPGGTYPINVEDNSLPPSDPNHYSYIFVKKSISSADGTTEVGTLTARDASGSILTLVNDSIEVTGLDGWEEIYDAYRIVGGNSVIVEFTAENGYHVTEWQIIGVGADKAAPTESSLRFDAPGNGNAVVVDATSVSNEYTVAVKIPIQSAGQDKPGSIKVYYLSDLTTALKPSITDNFQYYTVAYGAELAFEFVDEKEGSIFYVAKWIVSPAYDLLQAENTSDIAMMTVSGNTAVYAILGPASGNVYGGGAYALVGDVTILLKGNRPVIDSPNNTQTVVNITGGEIGSRNAGSISTGNVYGGGYGPRAPVAGSTHIDISTSTVQSKDITIYGNVYGGGEMGAVGVPVHIYYNSTHPTDDTDKKSYGDIIDYADHVYGDGYTYDNTGNHGEYDATSRTAKISTNISIKQEGSRTITIGSKDDGNHLGNIFGGGQGGDLPQNVIDDLAIFDTTFPPLEGYAISYGISHIDISGIITSGVTIHGSVYGGGEGLLKGQKLELNKPTSSNSENTDSETTFDSRSSISEKSIIASVRYGQVLGDVVGTLSKNTEGNDQITTEGNAAYVTIGKDVTVTDSVFGGGKLAILGGFEYIENGNEITGKFTGKATVVHISGNVNGNVFGGGEGHASGAVSGSVKDTLVIIDGSAEIGGNLEVVSPIGLPISSGNVYGGGSLSITGNFEFKNLWDMYRPEDVDPVTGNYNTSRTDVIITGGTIKGSVYGGGFSPIATIAGSTHVWIGDYSAGIGTGGIPAIIEKTVPDSIADDNLIINGSVYGGGEMGSVGTTTLLNGTDENGQLLEDSVGHVSANVSVSYKSNTITIEGDIFGGGKGVLNVQVTIELHKGDGSGTLIKRSVLGQAMVRGYTTVTIEGNASNYSDVFIKESVFGGGKGVQNDAYALHYAKVYGYTVVNVSSATINGSVYGGGELGIIGQFIDKDVISAGESTEVGLVIDGTYYPKAVIKYVEPKNGRYNIYANQSAVDNNADPLKSNILIISREYCSDDLTSATDGTHSYGANAYYGRGTAAVTVKDSKISGSVYGGGKGLEINVLSGAVGRGTVVTIEDTSDNNSRTDIEGSVYGGGELGIVGSIITLIVGEGTSPMVKVTNTSHISNINDYTSYDKGGVKDLDKFNDIDTVVNIRGGLIHGSVFGAGKGEECNYEFSRGSSGGDKAIAYYKLSVFGRTEVNISNGIIYKHVYGGSENGEVGSLTILKEIRKFTTNYWAYASTISGKIENGAPSDIPEDVRDNGYGDGKTADLSKFSSAFVNIVGGTIHGNVFGGGYFGAIHGNTHVHIGWNAMMPDTIDNKEVKGDCHYYNDYDSDSGSGDIKYGNRPLPFVERNPDGTVKYKDPTTSTSPKDAVSLEKDKTVHDLLINGTVYAGGDRGDPSATTVSYDYISVYGTSHIILNGTGYNTGSNQPVDENGTVMHAMYLQGSIFGSGNSCTTFYSDKGNSRFITITNYNAVNELDNYIIYSIQRATEVTLINSRLRLPGRSDGSNLDKTALYSLNHVANLTLQSGSEIILDSVVQDLRSIYSKDGTGADTSSGSALNTIKLNNGMTLTIKTEKNAETVASPENILSNNSEELWPDKKFGKVTGYFFLDLSDASYYTSYVYGHQTSAGGFVYGNTFGSLRNTEITYEDFTDKDNLINSYRVWHPVGGGHLSASSTIVADKKGNSQGGVYMNTGKVVMPMTEQGAKYTLIGYNIYPAQSAGLSDPNPSLYLLGETDSFGNLDVNKSFKIKASLGEGFEDNENSEIWLTSGEKSSISDMEFEALGGTTLPEINVELYSNGVTQTTTAGYVVLLIQESVPVLGADGKPVLDDDNNKQYKPGNEISAIINIETQADGFGATIDNKNYTNNMNLYATREGMDDWNLSISNNNEDKYRFKLTSVSGDKHLLTNSDPASKDKYKIVMGYKINNDYSQGWDGFSFNDIILTSDTNNIMLGETDGRFNTSFKFTIYNLVSEGVMDGYATGTIILKISYEKISASSKADEHPLLAAGTDVAADTGTIEIIINLGEKKDWYNVDFVPAPSESDAGVGAIMTQQISYGGVAKEPTTPTRLDGKYTFSGWYREYNSDTGYSNYYSFSKDEAKDKITGDTTLYGKWVSNVTFDNNYDGSPSAIVISLDSKSGALGEKMSFVQDPVRSGYLFKGWYTEQYKDSDEADSTKLFNQDTPIDKNTIVYAKWDKLTYNIKFDKNVPDGAIDPGDIGLPQTIPVAGDPVNLDKPSTIELKIKDSTDVYTFVGWGTSPNALTGYTGSIALSNLITDDNTKDNGDGTATITLYAVWQKSTMHTITVTTDPITAGKYVNFEYYCGDIDPVEGTPWDKITNGAFSVSDSSTVYLRYSVTVPGYSGDGAYSLEKWSYDGAESKEDILTIENVTGDKSVTLSLTGKSILVNLVLDGGTLESGDGTNSINVTFGEKYAGLSDPTKLGYIFAGWSTRLINGSPVTSDTDVTDPTSPQTLYALWTPAQYNIIYHGNGGNYDGKDWYYQTFTYGESNSTVTLTSKFTNTDMIQTGWSLTADGSKTYDLSENIKITSDLLSNSSSSSPGDGATTIPNVVLELYAVWVSPTLTITFSDGGSGVLTNDGVTFDGDDWLKRIGLASGGNIKILISAASGGTDIDIPNDAILKWTLSGKTDAVSEMRDAATYHLTLSFTSDDGIFYTGEANFIVSPYTGKINITIGSSFEYDGNNPITSALASAIAKLTSGYTLTSNDLLDFETTYYKSGSTESITAPVTVGGYSFTLTAKADSKNYYNSSETKGAEGSTSYEITPKSLEITIGGSVQYNGNVEFNYFSTNPSNNIIITPDSSSLCGGDIITEVVIKTSSTHVGIYTKNGTENTLNYASIEIKRGPTIERIAIMYL